MNRVHIFVSGQVQGVLFRQNTKAKAEKLGLTGWVKNTDDGKVEITAEGDKEKLDELIMWCRKGSLFAKVDKVEVKWKRNLGVFGNFEII